MCLRHVLGHVSKSELALVHNRIEAWIEIGVYDPPWLRLAEIAIDGGHLILVVTLPSNIR